MSYLIIIVYVKDKVKRLISQEKAVLKKFPKKIEKPLDKHDFMCYANDNISNALTGKKDFHRIFRKLSGDARQYCAEIITRPRAAAPKGIFYTD